MKGKFWDLVYFLYIFSLKWICLKKFINLYHKLKKNPHNPHYDNKIGYMFYFLMDNKDKHKDLIFQIIQFLREEISRQPDNPIANYLRGRMAFVLQDLSTAKRFIFKAKNLDPKNENINQFYKFFNIVSQKA